MEIGGNNLSEPVRFYTKNTENLIKRNVENTDISKMPNIFSGEHEIKEKAKLVTSPIQKKRKSKRLNVLDTEYISDDRIEQNSEENIFTTKKETKKGTSINKILNFVFTKIPIINPIGGQSATIHISISHKNTSIILPLCFFIKIFFLDIVSKFMFFAIL